LSVLSCAANTIDVYFSCPRPKMDCSFSNCTKIACGSSRGLSEVVLLRECNDDIAQHLASCHLSNSKMEESELILTRAGYFNLTPIQIERMLICPNHRHGFGRYWRAPRTCRYPAHSGPKKKCKDRHVINADIAKSVQLIFNVTIEIGSRKYSTLSL
jgi:hypothetical protein